MNLSGKSYLKLLDFTSKEINYLLDSSRKFKVLKNDGQVHKYLEGKNLVLIFEKTSTRTRCSFEVAAYDLGMNVTYLSSTNSQMGHKESVKDTARVLGRLYDGIEYRGHGQEVVEDLAEYSGIPVFNGLTNEFHPTQALADVLTIEENFGKLKGLDLVYMGDARNNVADSLMVICAKLGINFTACSPDTLFPDSKLLEEVKKIAKENGSTITLETDVKKATKDADIIYTDVWVSMGEADEIWETRIKELLPYQVNKELMENASDDAIFLHCLPAYHNLETGIGRKVHEKFGLSELEVTNQVFESDQSKVFDQAENRMHTIKAIIYACLKEPVQKEEVDK